VEEKKRGTNMGMRRADSAEEDTYYHTDAEQITRGPRHMMTVGSAALPDHFPTRIDVTVERAVKGNVDRNADPPPATTLEMAIEAMTDATADDPPKKRPASNR
jgi:hypothetical protein